MKNVNAHFLLNCLSPGIETVHGLGELKNRIVLIQGISFYSKYDNDIYYLEDDLNIKHSVILIKLKNDLPITLILLQRNRKKFIEFPEEYQSLILPYIKIPFQEELKKIKDAIESEDFYFPSIEQSWLSHYFATHIRNEQKLWVNPKFFFQPYNIITFIHEEQSPPTYSSQDRQLIKNAVKTINLPVISQFSDFKERLLDLMSDPNVSFESCVTVNMYLMLKQAKNKINRTITFNHLVNGEMLTETGMKYLQKIADNFATLNLKINFNELEKFILALPPTEQSLIIFEDNDRSTPCCFPFVQRNTDTADTVTYLIPSFSIINFILTQINKNPTLLVPYFGKINSLQIACFHQHDIQPMPIGSENSEEDFCTNLINRIIGAVHMNMFSKEDRSFIFDFARMLGVFCKLLDDYITDHVSHDDYLTILKEITSFNVSEPDLNQTGSIRDAYLRRILNDTCPNKFLKHLLSDNAYYIFYYANRSRSPKFSGKYPLLLDFIESHIEDCYKDQEIINTIKKLVYYRELMGIEEGEQDEFNFIVARNANLKSCKIDWSAWIKLLAYHQELINGREKDDIIFHSDKEYDALFWNLIKKNSDRFNELLVLIQNGLMIYPFEKRDLPPAQTFSVNSKKIQLLKEEIEKIMKEQESNKNRVSTATFFSETQPTQPINPTENSLIRN